jgi:hypothetical protein
MARFAEKLFDFAYVSDMDSRLQTLAEMAEPEDWSYKSTQQTHPNPVLFNYIQYTYMRLVEEDKIEVSVNAENTAFDTGLVTPNQDPIYALFSANRIPDQQPWFLSRWCLPGEHAPIFFILPPKKGAWRRAAIACRSATGRRPDVPLVPRGGAIDKAPLL